MKTIKINSWSDFKCLIDGVSYTDYIFRGQGSSNWELQSSFFRACSEIKPRRDKIMIENILLESFIAKSHHFFKHLPDKSKKLEWLSMMQHYGAVTKLLDWSHSPFIALFFAITSSYDSFAIFQLEYKEISNQNKRSIGVDFEQTIIDKKIEDKIIIHQPTFQNQRIISQQGLFTYNTAINKSIQTVLDDYDEVYRKSLNVISTKEEVLSPEKSIDLDNDETQIVDDEKSILIKYVFENLSSDFIGQIYNDLKLMNIHYGTLFPDIEGLCRSLKYKMLEKDIII